MTYADLWQILVEAEARHADKSLPADVRARSYETVQLCLERMAREGLTRDQLKALAFADDATVADGVAGMEWWNGLDDAGRESWMTLAGGTGVAADAWEAYKRARASAR